MDPARLRAVEDFVKAVAALQVAVGLHDFEVASALAGIVVGLCHDYKTDPIWFVTTVDREYGRTHGGGPDVH